MVFELITVKFVHTILAFLKKIGKAIFVRKKNAASNYSLAFAIP